MRSILEKAIVALLNEQHDEANQLMHKFMVGRARQIHESLRNGDDSVLDENWNEELSEEYFTEDDLNGLESGEEDDLEADADTDLEDEGDDLDAAEVDAADAEGDEHAADGLETEMGDAGGEPVEVDPADVQSIRDDLEALMAEFETVLNGGEPSDDDAEGDVDGDMPPMGGDDDGFAPSTAPDMDDMSAPMDGDMPVDGEDESDEEPAMHESEEESEDFDDLAESIVSELEKINVDMGTDGKEFGGKSIEQNRKSVVGGTKANAQDAAPITIKSSTHTGYERETAPSVKDMSKKSRNVNAKADAGRTTVSKEGDKGALLNKDFAGGK